MVGPNPLPSFAMVVVVGHFGQLQPWEFEDGNTIWMHDASLPTQGALAPN